jgi:small subunit ribosomal protein S6
MSNYETVFIARQDLSTNQVSDLTKLFETVLADNGAKLEQTENWGLRSLAYRINKNRKGHYVLFHFSGPADALNEMERQMRLHEDVLRYMTVKIDEIPADGTVMMKNAEAA